MRTRGSDLKNMNYENNLSIASMLTRKILQVQTEINRLNKLMQKLTTELEAVNEEIDLYLSEQQDSS